MLKFKDSDIMYKVYTNRDEMNSEIQISVIDLINQSNILYNQIMIKHRLNDEVTLCNWKNFFNDKNEVIIIAILKKNNSVVGYVSYFTVDNESNKNTYIHNVYVKDEFRRYGVASHMIRMIFESRENSQFSISIYNDNKNAIKFWESLGFYDTISQHRILNFW